MTKRFLDYDEVTKTTQYIHVEPDGNAVIESIQDAQDILDFNEAAAKLLDKKKDMWFVGSIPLQMCQQWANEYKVKVFSKEWMVIAKQKVQDPDYRKLNPNNIKL